MAGPAQQGLTDGVAIIGMAGRFPGAADVGEFWENLRNGVESITWFTDEELIASGVDPAVVANPDYVKASAVLSHPDQFDAAFFGYSPREAEIMDPQHRLLLECAWEALENAGYAPGLYPGPIGVFAGVSMNSYLLSHLAAGAGEHFRDLRTVINNNIDFAATRVSYKLNLKGPALSVQTSCSTSLVAIHLACQSLLNYESDMALAGGVAVGVPHKAGYLYQPEGVYSPDGHCRAFDEKAKGTVGGNGAAIVALKRLGDAISGGDTIHAVIRGTALNNDGSDKVGFTAPSVNGQAEVIAMAQAVAGFEPDTITYIETHGTGTDLGDPIEVAALTQAFRSRTDKQGFCAIGSLKTNVGHLDAAAGAASVIKTALALGHQVLPASLNFEKPSPKIPLAGSPFYVNATTRPWPAGPTPRRAGVSSFGMGGTNAHAVLEEAPPREPSGAARPSQLVVLSARTAPALERATANLAAHLNQHPELELADVAYTLQVGRKAFPHRRMIVAGDLAAARAALASGDPKRLTGGVAERDRAAVVFLFPGQGSQYPNMALELYRSEPEFRRDVDECSERLRPHLGFDLRQVLYPEGDSLEDAAQKLKQTFVTQPALFVIEYALARRWMDWGVRPRAMIGHSIGEYVAATIAGVFRLEDALKLVAARGRLMQQLPGGAMLAVPLSAREVEPRLDDRLAIAVIDEPDRSVVSGTFEAVAALEARLEREGVTAKRVHVSHAFHSPMMEPILEPFTALVGSVDREPPRIPYLSNYTGTWITAQEATSPAYWARHLRHTVRFESGLNELLKEPGRVFLEVGPGRTLSTLATRLQRGLDSSAGRAAAIQSIRHPQETVSDNEFLMGALGRAWLAGTEIDWAAFHAGERRCRLPLPTYPFERQRYWIEPRKPAGAQAVRAAALAKKPDIADWFYAPSWSRSAAPLPVEAGLRAGDGNEWLVFDDASGWGEQIIVRLRELGQSVVTVGVGDSFRQLDESRYLLRPGRREDYDALFGQLAKRQMTPGSVLHLWGVGPGRDEPLEIAAVERAQDRGFYSILFLAQAFERIHPERPLGIVAATSHVQSVSGVEQICPERATVLGAARAVSQEFPRIACHSVDIEAVSWNRRLVDALIAESGAAETVVAYRGPHRWVECYAPFRAENRAGRPALLRDGGVYLITGGLGAIGLEAAECLARSAEGVKLVLTGRSEFPPPDAWDGWAASQPGDEGSRRIAKLQAIQAAGAEVMIVRADVADLAEMQTAIRRAEERLGPLNGVVHAAGGDKSLTILQDTGRVECERQFRAKLAGVLVLEKLLTGRRLDFCLLQSSLSSVLGALGLVAYAGAHHFVDAYVLRHNRSSEVPWNSVNWDNWLSWREPELAFSPGEARLYMTPEEGCEAFRRVLNMAPGTQAVHSTGDLAARIGQWIKISGSGEVERAGETSDGEALHARPDTASAYAAPRNEVERTLAAIFGKLLGIRQVGIEDSFFELGGDSVLSLQVAAKAGQAGIRITPAQVFELQTVARLAEVAGAARKVQTEQGPSTGDAPLTPIQQWFFENDYPDPHHFNLPMVLEVPAGTDPAGLERALAAVISHHDVFRLRYRREAGVWRQFHAAAETVFELERLDLAGLPADRWPEALIERATRMQASLDLAEGPIMRALVARFGAGQPARLLWIVHHLVADYVSWRVLVEDLQTALDQFRGGVTVALPPKTTSFKKWAEWLDEHARSEAVRRESGYWLRLAGTPAHPLPLDFPGGANTVGSTRTLAVSLTPEETRALLEDGPRPYSNRVQEVLLAALVEAFAPWTGARSLLINMEGHGREGVPEGLDVSRTVGWFTALYPVLLDLEGIKEPGGTLKSIKEQINAIPNGGIGHGLLRYLGGDRELGEAMRRLPLPEVTFLYLGQMGKTRSGSAAIRVLRESYGPSCSPQVRPHHLLEVIGQVAEERLQMEWYYSENIHRPATIQAVAGGFLDALRSLIAHCQSPEAGGFTPSDFPAARVSQQELDKLFARIGRGSA